MGIMEQTNQRKPEKNGKGLSASFVTGAIALAFLVIGYQTALFVHKAAVLDIIAKQEKPDTVFVVEDRSGSRTESSYGAASGTINANGPAYRKSGGNSSINRSATVKAVKEKYAVRHYESFNFDPNTISVADLIRLGFTQKQAESIDNYRQKGGRFRRKEDFAKSYVVADSVYRRLEKYIDIPKIDINKADSTTFETLPGIGPYFAAKMVSYRKALGGYSYKEQLMDIYHFDEEKFNGLKDLITLSPCRPYGLWTLPADSLSAHPYIDKYAAKGIELYRNNNPVSLWTVSGLEKAGIIKPETAARLARCNIAEP